MTLHTRCAAAALALILWLALPLPAACEASSGYVLAARNDRFLLYVNPADTLFYVEAAGSGTRWHACPPAWEDDPIARGNNRKMLRSLLSLTVYNEKEVPTVHHSFAASVEKEDFDFRLTQDGFEAVYRFGELGVELLLRIRLTEDGFEATVPVGLIRESGEAYKLGQISLLPVFDAALPGEDGYLLVPDGSGMLIRFDKTLSLPQTLTRPVYGRDLTLENNVKPLDERGYALPVFGMKRGDQGYLAIITRGDAASAISSAIAGDRVRFFRSSAALTYRERHTVILFENSPEESTIQRSAPQSAGTDFSVRYRLLEHEALSYTHLAESYREWLTIRGQLPRRDTRPRLLVNLLGMVRQRKELFGIPYNGQSLLTTFGQAGAIAQALSASGVDRLHMGLYGFQEGGLYGSITDIPRPASRLGGQNGLETLERDLSALGAQLTWHADLLKVYRAGRGFHPSQDAARAASGGVAYQYEWDPVSLRRDHSQPRASLLAPEQLVRRMQTLAQGAKDAGIGALCVEGMGSMLYSQLRPQACQTRDVSVSAWQDAADAAVSQGLSFHASGANACLLPYADSLEGVPLGASGFDIQSEEVPFFQLVLSGSVPYYGMPGNLRRDAGQGFLRMIEYGAYPRFDLFYAPSRAVENTQHRRLFSGSWTAWSEQAAREYEAVRRVFEAARGSRMTGHACVQPGVFRTDYENGAAVYVNYNPGDVAVGTCIVPGMGYALEGGAR